MKHVRLHLASAMTVALAAALVTEQRDEAATEPGELLDGQARWRAVAGVGGKARWRAAAGGGGKAAVNEISRPPTPNYRVLATPEPSVTEPSVSAPVMAQWQADQDALSAAQSKRARKAAKRLARR